MQVYVLTTADLGAIESDKPSENFEGFLTAPAVFSTWQAAADAAQGEHDEIWSDQSEAEADPAPRLEWEHTGGREWNTGVEDWGVAWRITVMEVQ